MINIIELNIPIMYVECGILSLFGIIIISWFQAIAEENKFKAFITYIFSFICAIIGAIVVALLLSYLYHRIEYIIDILPSIIQIHIV